MAKHMQQQEMCVKARRSYATKQKFLNASDKLKVAIFVQKYGYVNAAIKFQINISTARRWFQIYNQQIPPELRQLPPGSHHIVSAKWKGFCPVAKKDIGSFYGHEISPSDLNHSECTSKRHVHKLKTKEKLDYEKDDAIDGISVEY